MEGKEKMKEGRIGGKEGGIKVKGRKEGREGKKREREVGKVMRKE